MNTSYQVSTLECKIPVREIVRDLIDVPHFHALCKECPNYRRRWSCPPFDWDPLSLWLQFDSLHVVARVLKPLPQAKSAEVRQGIEQERSLLLEQLLDIERGTSSSLALSPGPCMLCGERCARADGKLCRMPGKRRYSIEALGGDVGQLAQRYLNKKLLWFEGDQAPEYQLLVGGLLEKKKIAESVFDLYKKKLVSPVEGVKVVRSGDWVDYGWCTNHPVALDKALAARKSELTDVKVRGGVTMWMPEICAAEDSGAHFTWHSWHMSGIDRSIMEKGKGYFIPMRYSELPRFYREDILVDVAMIQVTPMDKYGNFNFGMSASHLADMLRKARCVIVEVNRNLPWVNGLKGSEINIRDVDMVVEGENPPVAVLGAGGQPSQVDRAVAELIVPQIPDGACLQLGIGRMPNAIGAMIAQSDLKDLGVHTEMYVDAYVDIAMAGKINGRHKAIDNGRQVFAFAAGSQKLYDYISCNPEVMGAPVDYTNDVRVIAQLDHFISINNAVDLDLFGQVNAESAGLRQISGTGGQLDFVMGAYLSEGGKSFVCLPSTVRGKDGSLRSRIVPTLSQGSIVTDPRSTAQYLVTEYGMVNMKGASTWERAEKIISIAHPDFRDELIAEAEKMGIWRKSNRR